MRDEPPEKAPRSKRPPRRETLEVQAEWLEIVQTIPPPARDAARRASRAPQPIIRGSGPPPSRRETLEVRAEWLEIVETLPPPSAGGRRSKPRVSARPPKDEAAPRVRMPWEPPPLPPPPEASMRARRKLPPPLPREEPPDDKPPPSRRSRRPK